MRVGLFTLFWLLIAAPVFAQQAPAIGYVYPPVVRAGATTEVRLGGYDFTDDMQFFVHAEGVKLEVLGPPGRFFVPEPPYWFGPKGSTTAFPIPREVRARLTVPAGFPPGPVRWQVANANGAAPTGRFMVTPAAPVLESRDRDRPQPLDALPAEVAGRIRKIAEVDRYEFTAPRSGPVSVELFARRLGSNFHGSLQVFDQSGKRLADFADTAGRDGAVTFEARAGKRYTLHLHDVEFRGNRAFVYRLVFTAGPRIVGTLPAAGTRGKTIDVQFIGYGIATGRARVETVRRKVAFPAEPSATELQYQLKTPFGSAPPIRIPLSDLTESARPAVKSRQAITVPGAVTGRFGGTSRAAFEFDACKGDAFDVRALSRAIGGRLDLSLRIENAAGKSIASNDDLPGTTDAGVNWRVPKDGRYVCVLENLSGVSGNANDVFRLEFRPPREDFTLTCPQIVAVPLGGKAKLSLKVRRSGGFKGEIVVAVKGLPPGLSVPAETKIPAGKNSAAIVVSSPPKTATVAARVEITATATIRGTRVTRIARAPAAGHLCPPDPSREQIPGVILATTMKPPFAVELVDKNRQRAVHRGTTYPAEFIIRRDPGFTGEIQLQMAARQSRHRQGIFGPVVSVPPGAGRALYPCFLPEWLATDRTTRMVVLGVGKVRDPGGRVRFITKPADARITMILEGALLKLSHRARELVATPGGELEIPLRVARSTKLKGNVTIQLVVPEPLKQHIQCAPVVLPATADETKLRVKIDPALKTAGRWALVVKAQAMRDRRWPVVSQTTVPVEFTSPSQSGQRN